jgi:type II secretory pathway component PulF
MPDTPSTLDDFMALNEQLAALARARVPLDVGWTTGTDGPEKTLERINAAVARQVSRGATVDEAIERDPTVPPAYRCLVEVGLRGHDLDAALDGAQRLAETNDTSRSSIRAALFYPLIVCGLAYFGLIGVCHWLVPALEGMHDEMRIPSHRALHILQAVRDSKPAWIYIPPLLITIYVVTRLLSHSRWVSAVDHRPGLWARLTGRAAAVSSLQLANFADALATLLESQTPLAEAIPLAAGGVNVPGLSRVAAPTAGAVEIDSAPAERVSRDARLPPFLSWALYHSEPTVERPRALRMAAALYRHQSAQAVDRIRVFAPTLACILIGGTAVLLYGLALFAPLVDLLHGLSVPPGR